MTIAPVAGSRTRRRPGGRPTAVRGALVRRVLGTGLGGALLAIVIAVALATVVVPRVTGSVPLTILTGSMRPGLPPGTLVVVHAVPVADIRVGDVVTYQERSGDPTTITHRVIGVTTDGAGRRAFLVQGDANAEPDAPVLGEQVRGRVWYAVPYVGFAERAVAGPARAVIAPLGALALFGYAAWLLAGALLARVRRRAAGRVARSRWDAPVGSLATAGSRRLARSAGRARERARTDLAAVASWLRAGIHVPDELSGGARRLAESGAGRRARAIVSFVVGPLVEPLVESAGGRAELHPDALTIFGEASGLVGTRE